MIDTQKFVPLKFELAVFHRVYGHRKEEKMPPTLSGNVVKFDGPNADKGKFLREELIKAIHKDGVTISFKEGEIKESVPSIIKELFLKLSDSSIKAPDKEKLFLERSRWFATKLDSYHKGLIPSGILAIMYGRLSDTSEKQILIIAKIEEERALQVLESEENKIKNLDIRLVEKLIMLHKANVMKAGVFYNE
jgi:hypothetical protein